MTRLVYYVATSIDGLIADVDGRVDWLAEWSDRDYGYQAFFDSLDAMVMGRHTWEQLLSFDAWPYGDKPCFVCSRSTTIQDERVTPFSGSPTAFVAEMQKASYEKVWMVGGTELASSFHRDGLISEIVLTVLPVFLGNGLRLFQDAGPACRWNLADTHPYSNGAIQLTYLQNRDKPADAV